MYISVDEAAVKFNISKRRVQVLCEEGRINGASIIGGAWRIPKSATKPVDKRKKRMCNYELELYSTSQEALTITDVCELLSISKATLKNWIRLRKIVPDIGDQLFSRGYIEHFIEDLKSNDNIKLKSRRNKKQVSGKILYRDYIYTESNQKLIAELLEISAIESEKELLIVLANFAVQLYYQSRNIEFTDNNVLLNFLSKEQTSEFYVLIKDLIGECAIDPVLINKLQPVLSKRIQFVKGEDSLGGVYISLRDIGQRKNLGTYYTPQKIVNKLIDLLYENSNLQKKTICDPCCGTGNFLLSLCVKGVDYSTLYGQDIDSTSVFLSRINIALVVPEISALEIRSRITIGNTYFESFTQKFDIVVGNPPWGSNFSEEDISKCRKILKTASDKNIESYDLFVEKALSMLVYKGMLAFVLPEAILNVAAHNTIRKLMLDSCSFRFVSYLGNVFSGVQCPSIILGITPDNEKNVVGCKVSTDNSSYTISEPRIFSNDTLSFNVSDEENRCLNAISNIKNVTYLKDNAQFALGIVTGNNKEYLSTEKGINNEVILKGNDITRYRIKKAKNYIRFVPESFQQVAPVEMYRAKEKLLYRFISEVPVFAYDNQQTLSLNSCNVLIPRIKGLEIRYILAILNSSVTAYFIAKKFNSVKLLRSHIEQMPIPFVPMDVQIPIIKEVDRIMNSSENISELYKDLDNEVMKLFGLSKTNRNIIKNALYGKNLFIDT